MNCACNKPAKKQIVQKDGGNKGKEFWSCAQSSSCNFFCWVNGMPSSFQPRPQSHSSSSNQRASSPAKKKSTNSAYNVSVRLNIIKFEIDSGVPRIWFSATHAPNTKLTKFYLSLPENLRKHDDRMKIWTFNFDLYDEISSQLQADEFDFVELHDLPRFLVEGLKKYIKKVNLRTIFNNFVIRVVDNIKKVVSKFIDIVIKFNILN